MAITYIGQVHGGGSGTFTTGSLNTTGSNLLVACLQVLDFASWSLTDSLGNTWNSIGIFGATGSYYPYIGFYYCVSPAVGSAHTFTITTSAGADPYLSVMAFAGVAVAASPFLDGAYVHSAFG